MDILLFQPNIQNIIAELPDKITWMNKLKTALDDEFRAGWDAQKNKEIKVALDHYKLAFKQGHKGAQFHLYCMYICGQDVPINFKKYKILAVTFNQDEFDFLLSCYMERSEHFEIQNNIGFLYSLQNNQIDAFKWIKRSADQGYGPALYNLGNFHYCGKCIEVDYTEALRLFHLSADRGIENAMSDIGDMYYSGTGVKEDYEQAYQWYLKSNNKPYSQNKIGSMYYSGHFFPKDYTLAFKQFLLAASKDINQLNII